MRNIVDYRKETSQIARRIGAKRAFVTANRIKNQIETILLSEGIKSVEKFIRKTAADVSDLDEVSLDRDIEWVPRLNIYLKNEWSLTRVDLRKCHVWPEMGGNPSLKGPVPAALDALRQSWNCDDKSRKQWEKINRQRGLLAMFSEIIPIIIATWENTPRVDDGNHRALAYLLNNEPTPWAWVSVCDVTRPVCTDAT